MDVSANRSWSELSSRQLSIWLELQSSGHASSYQIGGYTRISGDLDPERFRNAVALVAMQHQALRIEIDTSLPRQRVLDTIDDPVDVIDFSGVTDPEGAFLDLAERAFAEPFEFDKSPLFRLTLVRIGERSWYSLLRCHHLIIDGLSVPLLISLISQAYEQLESGAVGPASGSTYLDFVREDASYRASPRARRDLDFWREELAALPEPVFTPRQDRGDFSQPSKLLLRWELDRDAYETFVAACGVMDLRPMQGLLALVGTLVHQLVDHEDAVIGVAVPGRGRSARHKVGMFNGAMPVRLRSEAGWSLVDLAAHAGAQLARVYPAQRAAIDAICRELEVAKKGRRGIFEVFMSYIPADVSAFAYELNGIKLDPVILRGPESNPLAIYISESSSEKPVVVEFAFNPDYLTAESAKLLLQRFQELFAKFNQEPRSDLAALAMFTAAERESIRGAGAANEPQRRVRLVSSFTADPLEGPLRFWLDRLKIPARFEFADYNSLFQELLNPESLTRTNTDGVNLLFVRVEDWIRYRTDEANGEDADYDSFVRSAAQDFVQALASATQSAKNPYLLALCTPSADWCETGAHGAVQKIAEDILTSALPALPGLHFVDYRQIHEFYPCAPELDPDADRLGHVPFTVSGFTALATAMARRLHFVMRRKSKVIVVDCDNTLWGGVVGEDGVDGLRLDRVHLDLQKRLVAASEAGILVCLCSKNIEADVLEVFDRRSDMILRREHIVSHRINWRAKSQNIRDLAAELDLGLDSFVFLDDNPVEIAEVSAGCPHVTAIPFDGPDSSDSCHADHLWLLDVGAATAEDVKRTRFYKENAQRVQLRDTVGDFAAFIASLDLEIRIVEPADADLARLEQLTERTNQFNINGLRRSAGEFASMRGATGKGVRAIFVKDRFGDYGLVGVLMAHTAGAALEVDTLLMSCRVLGRGVEHGMIAELGRMALQFGADNVRIETRISARNLPVRDFIAKLPGEHAEAAGCIVTMIDAAAASAYAYRPERGAAEAPPPVDVEATPARAQSPHEIPDLDGVFWRNVATRLNTVASIETAVRETSIVLRGSGTAYRAPRTEREQAFADKLAELLGVDRVGIDDNLFELGLQSLRAVQFVAHVRSVYGVQLSVRSLFENPTISGLSGVLDQDGEGARSSALVRLQPGDGVDPLFCLHPANGDAVTYMRLAKALGPNRTVYAFEASGLAEDEPLASSVEDMAEAYIAEMMAVQPQGPYHLLGWSFGGVIAYEMAQRLRARGETVGRLFFMDATTPYGRDEPDLTFDDVMSIFANDLESIERTYEVRANPKRRQERRMTLKEFIKTAQRMGVAPPEYSEDEARRKIAVYTNNVRLFRKWHAPPSDLDIVQFKATKQRMRLPYRWNRHTSGAISVIRIPCNHVRIGFEPFVNQVALHVNAYLRNEPMAQPWWRRMLAAITRKRDEQARSVEPA